MLAYIGERLMFRVPSGIVQENGWKKYTSLAVFVDLGKITLWEADDDHSHDEIVMGDTRQIAVPIWICDAAGWRDGDAIMVQHHGREIVLERVRKRDERG